MTDKRMVRAILINPFACSVRPVKVDGDDYKALYPLLSHETMQVSCYEQIRTPILHGRDSLFVDEEGMLKDCRRFFTIEGFPQPLAGKGLVFGANAEGDFVDHATDLKTVLDAVRYLEMEGDGLFRQTTQPFTWEWIH